MTLTTNTINSPLTCHSCYGISCDSPKENCTNAVRCFSSEYQDDSEGYVFLKGCLQNQDQVMMQCRSSYVKSQNDFYTISCCKEDFCNNGTAVYNSYQSTAWDKIGIALGCSFAVILLVLLFFIRRSFHKKRLKSIRDIEVPGSFTPPANTYRDDLKATAAGDSTLMDVFQESMTSGSGFGVPRLYQRTIAKDVDREKIIGEGRFGKVWKGTYKGDVVAVKIFSSLDEASWKREKEIYNNVLVPHENLVGFYAADVASFSESTQMWLIMHYHPHGSLYHYLHNHTLDHQELMQILLSIVSGVNHLHSEITGSYHKPAIAHRDLKTNNILVKDDGNCCIADFGLAVMQISNEEVNIGMNPRVGTKRYLSPEALDGSINSEVFDSFRKADIYSLALVMWECCNLCRIDEEVPFYMLPYSDLVPHDPSFDQMKSIICEQRRRPSIPEKWKMDHILAKISDIMSLCWHYHPDGRLTSLRIKKDLKDLELKLPIGYGKNDLLA